MFLFNSVITDNFDRFSDLSRFSASIRRSSMRDKSMMSWKEAREEARLRELNAASGENADNKPQQEQAKVRFFLSRSLSFPLSLPPSSSPLPPVLSLLPPPGLLELKKVV